MCSGGSLAQLLQNAHDDFGPGVSEDELKRISLQMLQADFPWVNGGKKMAPLLYIHYNKYMI
jgi:hypothetical protein